MTFDESDEGDEFGLMHDLITYEMKTPPIFGAIWNFRNKHQHLTHSTPPSPRAHAHRHGARVHEARSKRGTMGVPLPTISCLRLWDAEFQMEYNTVAFRDVIGPIPTNMFFLSRAVKRGASNSGPGDRGDHTAQPATAPNYQL